MAYLNEWEPVAGLSLGHRYSKAPIVQAIVEFRVTTPEHLALSRLAALDFGEDYETPTPIYKVEGRIEVGEGLPPSTSTRESQVGLSFSRHTPASTVHASDSAFAFIRGERYTHWGDFIAEVERAWLVYRSVAQPSSVDSMGVRFVNHIPMPNKPVEIKDYLRTSIDISAYLPQAVENMFMQVEIPLPKQHASAMITSAILDGTAENPGGYLLLDVDVKTTVASDTSAAGFDELISTTLDRLRLAKNYVFEACITDATRGLIA